MGATALDPDDPNFDPATLQRHHERGSLWNRATLIERRRLEVEHAEKLLAAEADGYKRGVIAECARIRRMALGWVRQIEEDALDSTAVPQAEVLRDFAALLGDR